MHQTKSDGSTSPRRFRTTKQRYHQPCRRSGIKIYVKVFAYLAACSFTLATAGYWLLWMVMPENWVFGALYRMFLYHWEHPLQYIGLMSLSYAVVGTLAIISPRNPVGKWPFLAIPSIMVLSILIASPAGGVLWVIHDMQAGYFPHGSRFWNDLKWGAVTGITSGWLVIALSVPYNILGLILGYHVTTRAYKITLLDENLRANEKSRSPGQPGAAC